MTAIRDFTMTVERRRVRRRRRPDRLRQVDHAQPGHRAGEAVGRRGARDGRAGQRHRPAHRLRVPDRRAVSVAQRDRQRRRRPAVSRQAEGRGLRRGAAVARARQPCRARDQVSAPALRRHAQARGAGADLHQRAADPADGRAVLGARRADARADARRAAAAVGRRRRRRSSSSPTISRRRSRWPTRSTC